MRHLTTTAIILACAGCSQLPQAEGTETTPDWLTAPHNVHCTQEAIARVHRETAVCKEQTEHRGSYCYGASLLRNCDEPIDYGSGQ